ncbi:TMV resistance protein N-like [Dorcoceras hygrometricum]|uniref:TMV resistance protein N-like n=1 Tax=Dorcoceras hygrometricum TaxID=472368 RepID=A0A2Z7A9A0_9LAMI|nr:TMV resistance protein N-like [Dorcoceras hygrometricum]
MQYLNRAMHEQGYQESSVEKAQRLSCADLINHHHLVIFRCDDSVDHHKAVWYSGTKTQPPTTSKIALDLSGATTQPADHNVQRISVLKEIRLNILVAYSATSTLQSITPLSTKLKMERIHLPKAAKEQTKLRFHNHEDTRTLQQLRAPQFRLLQSPNWYQSNAYELSATNLGPNGGVKRRQSKEIGFG